MDQEPGIEKLYLILSPEPIEMSRYFDTETGVVLPDGPESRQLRGSTALGRQLSEWSKNAKTLIADPGFKRIILEGYGVSSDPNRPALVEVDLKHQGG
jgi:hypothetical protein